MKPSLCHLTAESDYFRTRNFLREVFLLNNCLEHSWHVARLDYWRWHLILTCQVTPPFEQVTAAWETPGGQLIAIAHPYGDGEIRVHIHPHFRTRALENEIFDYIEAHFVENNRIIAPVFADDTLRREVLASRGFVQYPGWNHHYWRDLTGSMPASVIPSGYQIRSMGDESEHASRSWCSWRAFHADEPVSNYDGDHSWYKNVQTSPLYRRDLDVVAVTGSGEIAGFCTIYYDDYTRSAVTVLVGVAVEYWRRGLGKAVMVEGMRRLQQLGCIRVFSTAAEEPADALYRSVMHEMKVTDTWIKIW